MSASRMILSTLISSLMTLAWVPATQVPATVAPPEATVEPADTAGSAGSARPLAETMAETAAETATVFLRGPFGRVAGASPEAPAAAAPLGLPLDAFVRRAPLVLEAAASSELGLLEVVARPATEGVPVEILSTGATTFEGPDQPGVGLIVATLAGPSHEAFEVAWLVDVPDRPAPEGGLYDIPAPDVIVQSDDGEVAGVAGSGCYGYLCVDVGGWPPPRAMAPLPVGVDEVLILRLSDESAVTAWDGTLSPLGRTSGRARSAGGALTDAPEGVVDLAGLAVPGAGEWLLELKVVLDRERGWLRTAYRLVAH